MLLVLLVTYSIPQGHAVSEMAPGPDWSNFLQLISVNMQHNYDLVTHNCLS